MGVTDKALIIIFLLCFGHEAVSQDRYAIYYQYKPTEDYQLDNPSTFLSEDALWRRDRERVLPDSTDLPVSEKYVSEIQKRVMDILYHTRWLNASVVLADNETIKDIESLPFVKKVELVARGKGQQWESGKQSTNSPIRFRIKGSNEQTFDFQNNLLGINQMHAAGFTGKGIRIAVFDAGFQYADQIPALAHLFDEDRLIATRNFVVQGSDSVFESDNHGTGALSLMASRDERLLAGAYDASYILCITEDVASEFRIEEYNWVRAAEFADSLGVDIINSSLGYNQFDDVDMNYQREDMDGKTAIITIGATIAAEKGILVVTSGGNEGNLNWRKVTAPADAEGILAIGAVSNSLEKAGFSSVGPTADGRVKPDLVAYGTGVTLWRYTSGPTFSSGTSFSAPQVAALAAGIWGAYPDKSMLEIRNVMLRSGDRFNNPDSELGYGIPNFERALAAIGQTEEQFAIRTVQVYPNPLHNSRLFIKLTPPENCSVRLISPSGSLLDQWMLAISDQAGAMEFDFTKVIPGLYILEFQSSAWHQRIKLVKK